MDENKKKLQHAKVMEKLLAELGEKNENVVVFDSDLSGQQRHQFCKKIPRKIFDMGIAEQDMMSTAAGMSHFCKIPYASTLLYLQQEEHMTK